MIYRLVSYTPKYESFLGAGHRVDYFFFSMAGITLGVQPLRFCVKLRVKIESPHDTGDLTVNLSKSKNQRPFFSKKWTWVNTFTITIQVIYMTVHCLNLDRFLRFLYHSNALDEWNTVQYITFKFNEKWTTRMPTTKVPAVV